MEAATSHFLDLPFLPFFLLFLRPPGMTGLIAGGLVGDGFGAEASVVAAAAAGASFGGDRGGGACAIVSGVFASPSCGKESRREERKQIDRSAIARGPPCYVCA